MSSFPRTPRTQRGAIVGLDPFNPVASLVVFQYNPDTMTRTLTPQMSGEGGDRTEALRLKGAPVENIRVEVEIDATDQLAQGDALAGSVGIYPQLSSLEMLVYPKTAQVILNAVLMQVGTLEVVPATAPLTLFVWGPKRVLPVKLTEFTITEEAFDPNLNPIRAKVSLGLRVLSYNDLPLTHPGYALFLTHQVVKEAMAVVGSISGVANASLPR
ncbi:hypothetical protein LXT21_21135 [Myxococcus sp. K38C18041901]|uniref:hypothetical protein n=1 Tax=Myxococcus guangdongensis TaxID=2906760 RepID=UPI0020A70867|nr:hypothetical protein [Myxococcus guangdongensis]MCP3061289.1 hypothetical protein [Myxococcus guangdongensis]